MGIAVIGFRMRRSSCSSIGRGLCSLHRPFRVPLLKPPLAWTAFVAARPRVTADFNRERRLRAMRA
jgi:hypothetical protein